MRTITTKLYSFIELSADAQKYAIRHELDEWNQYGEPLMNFGYDIEEKTKEAGFNNVKSSYSFSYSQGDGLRFDCNYQDVNIRLFAERITNDKELQNLLADSIKIEIVRNNSYRYSFPSIDDVSYSVYSTYLGEQYSEITNKLYTAIQEEYMKVCKELEKLGYQLIEAESSEEASINRLTENDDIEYLENGKVHEEN